MRSPHFQQICLLILLLISQNQILADFESASAAYKNRDYNLAFEQFTELAEAGDARAQTVLAIMYKYGESVSIDMEQAFHWYKRAASQNYPPAQYNVGIMLLEGSGTPSDSEKAKDWLQQAADAGFERAIDTLAEMAGNSPVTHDEEPVAWSKQWNLRLPNDIREQTTPELDQQYRVYRVQLGAMSTIEGAERLWQQLQNRHAVFFEGLQPIYREAKSAGRAIVRLQMGPFETHSSAEEFCADIKRRAIARDCLVLLTD